ncbi:MAG: hypothetical protein BroJett015_20780 [Chloroflexota bacterium]|nr:MAG: hypothetical protein BroJett015_20780 [Chloroflexota bacterium]
MYFDQNEYDIRFEWGLSGLQALRPVSDVLVIMDVLSFTTCVDIVVGRGGVVLPYRGQAEALPAFAHSQNALYASPSRQHDARQHDAAFSLSPASLLTIPAGTRLVLPSPNGSTLSLATGDVPTLAGCLRNATAVAAKAQQLGQCISIIAAGERWPDGLLRPSLEDPLGDVVLSFLNNASSRWAAAPQPGRPARRGGHHRPIAGYTLTGSGHGRCRLPPRPKQLARHLSPLRLRQRTDWPRLRR